MMVAFWNPMPNKTRKMLHFTQSTIDLLKLAAVEAGMSESIYTEIALRAQFKKQGVKPLKTPEPKAKKTSELKAKLPPLSL